ncbi:MAG: PilW family protein [Synechococcus sp.]
MRRSDRGMTFVELLIGSVISGVLILLIGRIFSASVRTNRVNQQGTSLFQNSELAAAILQGDLQGAGYRGGNVTSFGGSSPNDQQAAHFTNIVRWPFTIDFTAASNSGLLGIEDISGIAESPLPTVVYVPGSDADSDVLGLVRVIGIDENSTQDTYALEYVSYGSTNGNLTRLQQSLSCSAPVRSNSSCRLSGANSGNDVAIEGLESFHAFFKLNRTQSGLPVYTSELPADISSVASVGIYMRLRATLADPNFTDSEIYPNSPELPRGVLQDGTPISQWSDIGVPAVQPYDDAFRRQEKVLEISLVNSQPCNQLPLAWPVDSIPNARNQAIVANHAGNATPGPGNFGWVTWNGDNSTPALLNSLNFPELSRTTYTDPTVADIDEPARHTLQVGSTVEGLPGNRTPGNVALSQYENQVVLAPVWNKAEGAAQDLNYTIVGFARILLLPGSTQNNLQGVYLGSASETCTI